MNQTLRSGTTTRNLTGTLLLATLLLCVCVAGCTHDIPENKGEPARPESASGGGIGKQESAEAG